jgi:hypothetical protein
LGRMPGAAKPENPCSDPNTARQIRQSCQYRGRVVARNFKVDRAMAGLDSRTDVL